MKSKLFFSLYFILIREELSLSRIVCNAQSDSNVLNISRLRNNSNINAISNPKYML